MGGRALHVGPNGGSPIWSLGGHFRTLARADDTDDAYSLVEAIAFQTTEPPLHIHTHESEAWYVLEGQMTFQVGNDTFVAGSGSYVFAPKGIPHAFTVDVEPTRVLVLATPAGFEAFADELGTPAFGTIPPADLVLPTPESLGQVAERYGIQVVGPPLRAARK